MHLAIALALAAGISWGAPVDGLRIGIGPGSASPEPMLRVILENVGKSEIDVPLGSQSAKGPVYDLDFRIKPPGRAESPLFNMNGPAGIAREVKPIVASIAPGKTYEVLLPMKRFVLLENGKSRTLTELLPLHYSVRVGLDTTSDATTTHVRSQWLGKIISGELRE